jgi:hypothetical protein
MKPDRKGGIMKVKILIKVALVILATLAKQTDTQLDDIAVKKLKKIVNSKSDSNEPTERKSK